jgi:hypothetical protein
MSVVPAEAAAPLLVVTAHPGDAVRRAGGAIAPTTAARHLGDHYTDLCRRRAVQAKRDGGPDLGLPSETWAGASMRAFPHVTTTLG